MVSIRCTLRCLFRFLMIAAMSGTASPQAALFTGVYHEAGCPSVDTTRMVRMKRHTAEAKGLVPAIDCHPDARVRYLGVGPSGPSPSTIDEEGVREPFTSADTRRKMEPRSKNIYALHHRHAPTKTALRSRIQEHGARPEGTYSRCGRAIRVRSRHPCRGDARKPGSSPHSLTPLLNCSERVILLDYLKGGEPLLPLAQIG
jgi:hypothetical protein